MFEGSKNSCYQCERRHQGCHADCPDYLAEREARMKYYQQRNRENAITTASIDARENRLRVSRQGDKYQLKKKRGGANK